MCHGDWLNEREVDYALEEAPNTIKNRAPDEQSFIMLNSVELRLNRMTVGK